MKLYEEKRILNAVGILFFGILLLSRGADAAGQVDFSQPSGAYEQEFYLTLSAGGDAIYFTLDGSDPTDGANGSRREYSQPILISDRRNDKNVLSGIDPSSFDSANVKWDKTEQKFVSKVKAPADSEVDKATIVRAVSRSSDGTYSAVQTNTYFVGSIGDHIRGIKDSCRASGMDLSIMSISVNAEDFFDPEKGIYVRGNIFDRALQEYLKKNTVTNKNAVDVARGLDANYKQRGREWERKAHIDYFESDGEVTECKLQQDCGVRIQGNFSRSDLQKGLRLYAREEYGKKNFGFPFFGDAAKDDAGNTIKKYKKITLRNGGNCAFSTKCSDSYWQSLVRDLACETQVSRACVVYLNGEYWGLYILQEDYDDNYFEITHGVEKKDVVLYKGDAEKYSTGYKLDEGELPAGISDESYFFKELQVFFRNHSDLKRQDDYNAFARLVDVESVRDYFAVNVWINNKWDWPGKNWSAWKVVNADPSNPYADGRWRLCLYDLDFGGLSKEEAGTNTVKEDNYKEYGLLDMNTNNPIVLMYAYLMSNDNFRKDFADALNGLTEKNYAPDKAVAACEVYRDTYKPLYDQYFARYGVGSTQNAIYGLTSITGFINQRGRAIPNILNWIEDFYRTHTGYNSANPSTSGGQQANPTEPPKNNAASTEPPKNNATSTEPPEDGTTSTEPPKNGSISSNPSKSEPQGGNQKTVVKKKKVLLKVTAKKKKKVIKIRTAKKAKIRLVISRRIIKRGKKNVRKVTISAKKNKKGRYVFKLSKPLRKKDRITVVASRAGYAKSKKSIAIK